MYFSRAHISAFSDSVSVATSTRFGHSAHGSVPSGMGCRSHLLSRQKCSSKISFMVVHLQKFFVGGSAARRLRPNYNSVQTAALVKGAAGACLALDQCGRLCHIGCTCFLIGAIIFSVRLPLSTSAAARGPEKRRKARPPVTPGPRRSTRQLRRAGRQAAECERGGSPAPAGGTKARGSSRRIGGCGGQAGSAALLRRGARRPPTAAINAAHTLAGFGGAAAASPQAAARTANGRHAADAAHPVCTRQPECAALVARLAARNGL